MQIMIRTTSRSPRKNYNGQLDFFPCSDGDKVFADEIVIKDADQILPLAVASFHRIN